MKTLRWLVILLHRYLGIALSLLVVVWFASGIVMMYAGGMPRLLPELRLERLAPLDLSAVKVTPLEAADRAGLDGGARSLLLSVMGRPAYRFGSTTVFADTGERVDEFSVEQAREIGSQFMGRPISDVSYVETLTDVDQWTLLQGRQLPLHRFRVNDAPASELYVQPWTGEVVQLTTRRSRLLAWVGTIPHWLYFTALRENQPLWYSLVVWTSTLACVVTLLGLVLGVVQYRRKKPLRSAIPYSGWTRWHYVTGVVFGVFTLTWAFSGLLSMEPYAWTRATGLEVDREALTGGALDVSAFPRMQPDTWTRLLDGRPIKEVEFTRIQDEHYYLVRHAPDAVVEGDRERLHQPYPVNGQRSPNRALVSASTLEVRRQPFSVDSLMARLRRAMPDVPIVEQQLLNDYDSYYYSRGRQTPLPILRVKFADPAATWVYIDPEMSQVVAAIHRLNRVERWLYNGLHSLDFSFWYNSVAWDIGMITLCLGGLTSSGIGLLLGVRRLRRGIARAVAPGADTPGPTRQSDLWAGGTDATPNSRGM